jgi:cytochrome P450
VSLAGTAIPAGTTLAVVLGSANRDERRWTDPDRFDLRRDEGMHLGFATGRHYCVGSWLGRQGATVALRQVVERLPALRFAPGPPPAVVGWLLRRIPALDAAWD